MNFLEAKAEELRRNLFVCATADEAINAILKSFQEVIQQQASIQQPSIKIVVPVKERILVEN